MSIEQALRQLEVAGFFVLAGIIPAGEAEAVGISIEAAVAEGGRDSVFEGIKSRQGLISFDQSLVSYLANSRVVGIAAAFFSPHVRISMTTATITYPGNPRGGWHADWPFNQGNAGHIPMPYPEAVVHLTTIWILSPFSPETGGTPVVPGSHRK